MKISLHRLSLSQIPVDLFADPDGDFSYEVLVRAAGLDPESAPPPLIGALTEPWEGHPEGSAVVAGGSDGAALVAIVECGVATERAA
jgi:hypothetical protein